ncbi:hypothetical protein CLV24_101335 [Pontibacter ummariensis]|uniref:Uncharacterized protein n=1 Tax=Pontibacter ummariensis TaxID=1610492 RepID=A0A239BEC0_9BACT|nr:hypothetical protein [Pontibacter ummariensis]PRY16489.1 hypothetical protein CLV24_101335 [Pontibacter ummariensis]SNS06079.1 hypothetical protein SAMN06296052_101335 [Pontibacter ummariensis]
METATHIAEIYKSGIGAVYQCDRRNRLIVKFAGTVTALKVDAFLRLQRVVAGIDLEAMAASTERSSDVEIVSVCGCERCYVLTLPELCAFKELLEGARFALELNRLLGECLDAALA